MKKIVFMGTPEFAVPALKKLIGENFCRIVGVFTGPDKPAGRKQEPRMSPVKRLALENNLKVFQPASLKNSEIFELIKKLSPDAVIVAAYGQLIPQNIIDLPKFGVLNIHPSLLPKYRGASPIQYALLEGEEKTGVSIMLIDAKMDHGPIVASRELKISSQDTAETLHGKLSALGADLLLETLPLWFNGKISPKEQEHGKASYTKIITRKDGKIDWQKDVLEIERQIRAFTPWPGSFAFVGGKRLKIIKARAENPDLLNKKNAGKLFLTAKKELAVYCRAGNLILEKVQPEGKKEMTGEELARGNQKLLGAFLA